MERFHRNVSAFEPALQERPKVLKAVCVHLSIYISVRVIDNLVRVFGSESKIGAPLIGREFGTGCDMIPDNSLHVCPLTILDHFGALPPEAIVLEVEPLVESWGTSFSPAIEAAMDEAEAAILAEVEHLGALVR